MDNLSTHNPKHLYEFLPPDEAEKICRKVEFVYTPKHASWLNQAEIAISLLSRQCLDRRIGSQETLEKEVMAWQERQNSKPMKVDWQFTTDDARIKLKRLYPTLSP